MNTPSRLGDLKMNVNCFVVSNDYLYIQTVVLFEFLAKS